MLLMFASVCQLALAQTDISLVKETPVEIPILIFENTLKGDLKFIRQGGAVQYALRSNPRQKIKGLLNDIKSNSMIVNNIEVPFDDCLYIKGRVRTDKQLMGGLLAGIGASGIALGGALAATVPGVAILGGGIVALTTGITFITSHKKFKLSDGWNVYGGKMLYKKRL